MKRFILSVLLTLGLFGAARAEDLVFIANPQTTDTALSADEIKAVLLGTKTKWNGGGMLKLVTLSECSLHDKVIRDYTQRSADQFDKYWKKLVFTGMGMMPAVEASEAAMVDYVAANPGTFGYVNRSSVTPKVKVISVK